MNPVALLARFLEWIMARREARRDEASQEEETLGEGLNIGGKIYEDISEFKIVRGHK